MYFGQQSRHAVWSIEVSDNLGLRKSITNMVSFKLNTKQQQLSGLSDRFKGNYYQRYHGMISRTAKFLCRRNKKREGWGAAIAQWICVHLPFCRPGFESHTNHLCFYHLQSNLCHTCLVKITKINKKEAHFKARKRGIEQNQKEKTKNTNCNVLGVISSIPTQVVGHLFKLFFRRLSKAILWWSTFFATPNDAASRVTHSKCRPMSLRSRMMCESYLQAIIAPFRNVESKVH